jgi:hypothetical protein
MEYLPVISLKMNLSTFGYYLVTLGFIGLFYRARIMKEVAAKKED